MSTYVYFDTAAGAAYYLGFDLVLVGAPLRDRRVDTQDAHAVDLEVVTGDQKSAAGHAAIRAALLRAQFPDWAEQIDRAQARTRELAAAAGLDELPDVDEGAIDLVELG